MLTSVGFLIFREASLILVLRDINRAVVNHGFKGKLLLTDLILISGKAVFI